MATSDWVPFLTTALGGLLAAGGGSLAQWTGNRRADKRSHEELRRTAYGQFITAASDLAREFGRWHGRDQDVVDNRFDALNNAHTAVLLAGPPRAIKGTEHLMKDAHALWDAILLARANEDAIPEARRASAERQLARDASAERQLAAEHRLSEVVADFALLAQSILGTDKR